MIRASDILFSVISLLILSPILFVILIVGFFDTGSPIFRQERVGKGQRAFQLYKFRSMYVDTPSLATHLASASQITPIGRILRKSKLDELPQLWNVLVGEMSLVGPRPNLFNQKDLIHERESRRVYHVKPGITGLAQINKIDMSNPKLLAEMDAKMIENFNVIMYYKCIVQTMLGKGIGDQIKF